MLGNVSNVNSVALCCSLTATEFALLRNVVVSPSGKPGMTPPCIPPEDSGRFPIMPPGDCLPGGYRRPPGPFMMPRGPGMPILRHGAYVLPPDGRGTSDLHAFVNRVQPPTHGFARDGTGSAALGEMYGQRFPSGQKPSPYGPVEPFSTATYSMPREQTIKIEHHQTSGVAQSVGFANGSPADQGNDQCDSLSLCLLYLLWIVASLICHFTCGELIAN